jgi:hypothetical protein
MQFKSIVDLAKHLEKNQIKKALKDDVAKQARKTLKEHIVEDVYNEYPDPKVYSRTGGLLQDSNIDTTMENDNTLSIRSTRSENGRDIAEVIEYGHEGSKDGYEYPAYYPDGNNFVQPRPFHAETARELDEKGLAKKALADGLRKSGLKVE